MLFADQVAAGASPEWWEVAVPAFAAAGFGALVGGGITWWLQRGSWLRRARAEIYRGVLHEVHDEVNDTVERMKRTEEPQGQSPELGRRYSDLYRDASAASRKDGRKVERFLAQWTEIGNLANEWTAAKDGLTNQDAEPITRDYYGRQLVPWQRANSVLHDYNEFLKSKLG